MNKNLFLLTFLLFVACNNQASYEEGYELITEVYGVVVKDGEYYSDELKFKESHLFDKNDKEIGHFIYDTLGAKSFKEIYDISKNGNVLGSKFYDAKDSLLSIYKFAMDSLDRKKTVQGFEASSNELLRIEDYTYDQNGFLQSKSILTPDLQVVRRQIFENDENGNELNIRMYDANGDIIFYEEYKITKIDEENRWTEKWGFTNNAPYSYRKRIINRY